MGASTPVSGTAASTVKAIDVHGHYGPYRRGQSAHLDRWMTADVERVVERARQANTALTVVSPLEALLPRHGADVIAGNEHAAADVPRAAGLLQWVVVSPLEPATYDQARRMLRLPSCVGIKIHPEEHGYAIREHGGALFEFAAEHGAVILAHSGDPNSRPMDFLPFANAFAPVRLILAHLGHDGVGNEPDLQVRAMAASKHRNVYTDTSSIYSVFSGLIEWAVREVGADRVLYGTDSPLYFAPAQRARVDHADLSGDEKRRILRDNAVALLNLPAKLLGD